MSFCGFKGKGQQGDEQQLIFMDGDITCTQHKQQKIILVCTDTSCPLYPLLCAKCLPDYREYTSSLMQLKDFIDRANRTKAWLVANSTKLAEKAQNISSDSLILEEIKRQSDIMYNLFEELSTLVSNKIISQMNFDLRNEFVLSKLKDFSDQVKSKSGMLLSEINSQDISFLLQVIQQNMDQTLVSQANVIDQRRFNQINQLTKETYRLVQNLMQNLNRDVNFQLQRIFNQHGGDSEENTHYQEPVVVKQVQITSQNQTPVKEIEINQNLRVSQAPTPAPAPAPSIKPKKKSHDPDSKSYQLVDNIPSDYLTTDSIKIMQQLRKDCPTSYQEEAYPPTFFFNSDLKNSYINLNKEIYIGTWELGLRSGYGQIYYPTNSMDCFYQGEFQNDKRHGTGRLIRRDADYYIGDFKDDKFNGTGKYYEADEKYTYEGSFKDNFKHGQGVMSYQDGRYYEGDFFNNLKDGSGEYIDSDGLQYKGKYKNDLQSGLGRLQNQDGSVYEGNFSQDLYHGQGKLHTQDEIDYQGEFKFGHKHGYGVLTNNDSDKKFMGYFVQDKQHGEGIFITNTGRRYGIWEFGQRTEWLDEQNVTDEKLKQIIASFPQEE